MRSIEPDFALTTREVSGVDGEKKMSAGSANNLSGHRHEPNFLAFSTDPAATRSISSPSREITHMDKKGRRAQEEVELAEAELQVLKQELVVQHLIDTGEPTDEAQELLERVRAVAKALAEERPPSDQSDGQERQT